MVLANPSESIGSSSSLAVDTKMLFSSILRKLDFSLLFKSLFNLFPSSKFKVFSDLRYICKYRRFIWLLLGSKITHVIEMKLSRKLNMSSLIYEIFRTLHTIINLLRSDYCKTCLKRTKDFSSKCSGIFLRRTHHKADTLDKEDKNSAQIVQSCRQTRYPKCSL